MPTKKSVKQAAQTKPISDADIASELLRLQRTNKRAGGPLDMPDSMSTLSKSLSKMKFRDFQLKWNKAVYKILSTKPAGKERTALKKQLKDKYGIAPLPIMQFSGVKDTLIPLSQTLWTRLLTLIGASTATAQSSITGDTRIEDLPLDAALNGFNIAESGRNLIRATRSVGLDNEITELTRFIDGIEPDIEAISPPPPPPPQAPPPPVGSNRPSSFFTRRRGAMRAILRSLSTGVKGGMSDQVKKALADALRDNTGILNEMIEYLANNDVELTENNQSIKRKETAAAIKRLTEDENLFGGLNRIIHRLPAFTNETQTDGTKILRSAFNRFGIPDDVVEKVENAIGNTELKVGDESNIWNLVRNAGSQVAANPIVRTVARMALEEGLGRISILPSAVASAIASAAIPEQSASSASASSSSDFDLPGGDMKDALSEVVIETFEDENTPLINDGLRQRRMGEGNEIINTTGRGSRRPLSVSGGGGGGGGGDDPDPDIENQIGRRPRVRIGGKEVILTAVTAGALITSLIDRFGSSFKNTKTYKDLLPYTDQPPKTVPTTIPIHTGGGHNHRSSPPIYQGGGKIKTEGSGEGAGWDPVDIAAIPASTKTVKHDEGDDADDVDEGIGLHRAEEVLGGDANFLTTSVQERETEAKAAYDVFDFIPAGYGAPKKEQALFNHSLKEDNKRYGKLQPVKKEHRNMRKVKPRVELQTKFRDIRQIDTQMDDEYETKCFQVWSEPVIRSVIQSVLAKEKTIFHPETCLQRDGRRLLQSVQQLRKDGLRFVGYHNNDYAISQTNSNVNTTQAGVLTDSTPFDNSWGFAKKVAITGLEAYLARKKK